MYISLESKSLHPNIVAINMDKVEFVRVLKKEDSITYTVLLELEGRQKPIVVLEDVGEDQAQKLYYKILNALDLVKETPQGYIEIKF